MIIKNKGIFILSQFFLKKKLYNFGISYNKFSEKKRDNFSNKISDIIKEKKIDNENSKTNKELFENIIEKLISNQIILNDFYEISSMAFYIGGSSYRKLRAERTKIVFLKLFSDLIHDKVKLIIF